MCLFTACGYNQKHRARHSDSEGQLGRKGNSDFAGSGKVSSLLGNIPMFASSFELLGYVLQRGAYVQNC